MKGKKESEYLRLAEVCLWIMCINQILSHIPEETLNAPSPVCARILVVATVGIVTFICTYRYTSRDKDDI